MSFLLACTLLLSPPNSGGRLQSASCNGMANNVSNIAFLCSAGGHIPSGLLQINDVLH